MRRSTTPAKLASFLRAMRHEAGKTQDEVARAMGVPAEHIVRMESGRVEPKLSTVVRFLEALDGRLTLLVDTDRSPAERAKETPRRRSSRASPRLRTARFGSSGRVPK
jgi:transcriptional regulator with XRE-family HTH domain